MKMYEQYRTLYTGEYKIHGQKHQYHGYFYSKQEALSFFYKMEDALPCLDMLAVSEQPDGLLCGEVLYHSNFLQQIHVYLTGAKYLPRTFRFALMPVPLKLSHRDAFLLPLRQTASCEMCVHI